MPIAAEMAKLAHTFTQERNRLALRLVRMKTAKLVTAGSQTKC